MSFLLFDNNHLSITHDKNKQYLALIWKGFIPSSEFRTLACEIIKAVEKTKATKILSDNREWKIISPNDYSWAANHWFPKAEESGVKVLATVLSNDYFNRHAERTVQNMANISNMSIQNFETVQEAERWLTNLTYSKKSTAG